MITRSGLSPLPAKSPNQRGQDYHKVFTTLGASTIDILRIKDRSQANDTKIAKSLEDADLIFFTGGDQLRLTTIMGGSKVLKVIHDRLEAGALIAGTSAGAAVFSDTMIYEGEE